MIEVRKISSTTQLDRHSLFVVFYDDVRKYVYAHNKKEAEDKVRAAIEKKEK